MGQELRRIRQYLSLDRARLVANALVTSRFDYCNSLLRSLSGANLRRLQCIQNNLAHIVVNQRGLTRASPILHKLHWLPVKYRCMFKVATLIYKFLQNGTPQYFNTTFTPYSCSYNTRRGSIDKRFLAVPQFQPSLHKSKKQFNNCLAFDGSTLWNTLPDNIRTAPSLTSFRKRLKSHFFDMAFPP